MPYNPIIPQARDLISDSQNDILMNNQSLNNLIAVDHYTFGDPLEGKHKKLTLVERAGPPVTNATEISLFNGNINLTNIDELILAVQNAAGVRTLTSANKNVSGWMYLPSGILLKWGTSQSNGPGIINPGGTDNHPYPVANNIPPFVQVFCTFTQVLSVGAPADTNNFVNISAANYLPASFQAWGGVRDVINMPTLTRYSYLTIGI